MISDAPCFLEGIDAEELRLINAEDIKMICFRLAAITHTSMEYYMKMPYRDLIKFVGMVRENREATEEE